ncbi:GIY-YIG nuclease family protein [Rhodococcoides corynebacterioides]|uniref:GIY-YIG nuclease family protein n=1 Tax=Rhodococcoides corynebacterioides TaxID=53972 RepID=UPI003F7E014C
MNHRDPSLREHYVYRVFDAAGDLLYVGCTKRPEARWKEHRSMSPWWTSRAHTFRQNGPFNYETARAIEREALRVERPQFGWTPERHAIVRRRNGWQSKRTRQLIAEGQTFMAAHAQAQREAQKKFPGPQHVTNNPGGWFRQTA